MTLKGAKLDEYNNELGEEERQRILEDNFTILRQTLNATGIKNLVEVRDTQTITASTSTDWKTIPGYSRAFTCSSGFIEINFNSMCHLGNNCGVALFLDNKRMDGVMAHSATHVYLNLRWDGPLSAGKHLVEVKTIGGATIEVGHENSNTRLVVRETLL